MTGKRAAAIAALAGIVLLLVVLAVWMLFSEEPLRALAAVIPGMILLPVFAYLAVWSYGAMKNRRAEAGKTEAEETETAQNADKDDFADSV